MVGYFLDLSGILPKSIFSTLCFISLIVKSQNQRLFFFSSNFFSFLCSVSLIDSCPKASSPSADLIRPLNDFVLLIWLSGPEYLKNDMDLSINNKTMIYTTTF